ncbi:Protein NLRC5 [Holothuria leucospilota]|uniref:Protein NLRC5 n=1 Tax=Holothuria leucospilota TaxID=206669 RepID=A0A9Q1CPJ3_HOLLE|nr:Protein NLRC5 [Holothuria leucospilota]
MKPPNVVYLISTVIIGKIVCESSECGTPQYIEIGSVGLIQCSFPDDVYSVLWYKPTKFSLGDAFLTLVNSVKSGERFLSGEFDIYPNGSLIIHNVSIKHEGRYTVLMLKHPESNSQTYNVAVFVYAQTFSRVPVIDNCDNQSGFCFQMLDNTSEISCTIRDARPAIPLRWMLRAGDGDRLISSRLSIKNGTHHFFTSRVTITNAFVDSRSLILLVCKANEPSGLLQKNESFTLIQGSDQTLPNILPKTALIKRNTRIELNCTDKSISYLVWQVKQSQEVTFKTLLYAVFVGEHSLRLFNDDYKLQKHFSIVVDNVRVHHEGTYRCISSNGLEDDVNMYEVVVFDYPDPPYPVVDGCNHEQYCVLEGHTEGILTCTVKGIRPQVDLALVGISDRSSNALLFYDKTITIKQHGDTSDVILTSKYRCNRASVSRLTVECKVVNTNIEELQLSTIFDLLFLRDVKTTTEENLSSDEDNYWIIPVVVAGLLIFFLAYGLAAIKRQKKQTKTQVSERCRENENFTMDFQPSPEQTIEDKRSIFLKQIKGTYGDLYNAVQPIPYIRDRLFCVDRVFVEGGLEVLVFGNANVGTGTWENLRSYHNIFGSPSLTSSRKILEGEPGYGKSTLTLQFAYDWCNRTSMSPLKDVELLIILRLRQLGGVKSIYRAIRQFILPLDSPLTEADVKNIISITQSTMIILDGYDEYTDKDDKGSDVNRIIARQMFQDLEVILTTRSSCWPRSYSAQTKRVRLTGFDGKARDLYVKKVVVGNDCAAAFKILQGIQDNSLLADLCQVPLLFVMYAHMSHESKDTLCFNSVTSFFRHMIACFHTHMFNKMEDDNVQKYKLFEKEHEKLDNLAFEGITGKNQKIVWPKEQIRKRIGEDFYDQYIRTGILIEEDVLDITYFSDSKENGLGYRKIEVRFYHKLFGEWYAAHTLAERCKYLPGLMLTNLLRNVDPFDLQYFYRFACGLSSKAAEKIIKHLRKRDGGDKFAVLCILEKTGDMDTISDPIRKLCSKQIEIREDDTTLLQRSTIQLLEIASGNQVRAYKATLIFLF